MMPLFVKYWTFFVRFAFDLQAIFLTFRTIIEEIFVRFDEIRRLYPDCILYTARDGLSKFTFRPVVPRGTHCAGQTFRPVLYSVYNAGRTVRDDSLSRAGRDELPP